MCAARLSLFSLVALALTGCYGHHTVDEAVLMLDDTPSAVSDTGTTDSTSGTSDLTSTNDPCASVADTDVLGQIACDFSQGQNGGQLDAGALTDLIGQVMGGGQAAGNTTGSTGQLDLGSMLSLLGTLTGGGTNTTSSDPLTALLGLLGGGNQQQGGLDIGSLLSLFGAATGGSTTQSQDGGLGALLGLLGGGQTSTSADANAQGGLNLTDLFGQLGQLAQGAQTTSQQP